MENFDCVNITTENEEFKMNMIKCCCVVFRFYGIANGKNRYSTQTMTVHCVEFSLCKITNRKKLDWHERQIIHFGLS